MAGKATDLLDKLYKQLKREEMLATRLQKRLALLVTNIRDFKKENDR